MPAPAHHAVPTGFAQAVNRAMQEVAPDLHLRLGYEPDREYAATDGTAPTTVQRTDDRGAMRQVVRTGRMDGRSAQEIARTNFGVARVEHLPGNIGYLKLTRFVPLDLSRDTCAPPSRCWPTATRWSSTCAATSGK